MKFFKKPLSVILAMLIVLSTITAGVYAIVLTTADKITFQNETKYYVNDTEVTTAKAGDTVVARLYPKTIVDGKDDNYLTGIFQVLYLYDKTVFEFENTPATGWKNTKLNCNSDAVTDLAGKYLSSNTDYTSNSKVKAYFEGEKIDTDKYGWILIAAEDGNLVKYPGNVWNFELTFKVKSDVTAEVMDASGAGTGVVTTGAVSLAVGSQTSTTNSKYPTNIEVVYDTDRDSVVNAEYESSSSGDGTNSKKFSFTLADTGAVVKLGGKITFDPNGGKINDETDPTYSIDFIGNTASFPGVTAPENKELVGWAVKVATKSSYTAADVLTNAEVAAVKYAEADQEFIAVYKNASTKYAVNVFFQKADGTYNAAADYSESNIGGTAGDVLDAATLNAYKAKAETPAYFNDTTSEGITLAVDSSKNVQEIKFARKTVDYKFTATYADSSSNPVEIATQSGLAGAEVTKDASVFDGKYDADKYSFAWNDAAEKVTLVPTEGGVVIPGTLTVKTVAITYDFGEGKKADGATYPETVNYGDALVVADATPNDDHYVFLGWAYKKASDISDTGKGTLPNVTKADYQLGDPYAITLTAQYGVKDDKYTVIWVNDKDATGNKLEVANYEVKNTAEGKWNETVAAYSTALDNITTGKKATFDGWNDAPAKFSDGTYHTNVQIGTTTYERAMIIKPKWTEEGTVTVTFKNEKGEKIGEASGYKGDSIEKENNPITGQEDYWPGYEMSWQFEDKTAFEGKYPASSMSVVPVKGEAKNITVTFVDEDNAAIGVEDQIVKFDATVVEPVKEDFDFWYYDNNTAKKFDFTKSIEDNGVAYATELKLYGKYKTITYTWKDAEGTAVKTVSGRPGTVISYTDLPTIDGQEFAEADKPSALGTEDKTFTASWKKVNVAYYFGSKVVAYNESLDFLPTENSKGRVILGWEDSNVSGKTYIPSDGIKTVKEYVTGTGETFDDVNSRGGIVIVPIYGYYNDYYNIDGTLIKTGDATHTFLDTADATYVIPDCEVPAGYEFFGWATTEGKTKAEDAKFGLDRIGTNQPIGDEDASYYPVVAPINYTISFYDAKIEGGKPVAGQKGTLLAESAEYNVSWDTEKLNTVKPADPTAPDGYKFAGWDLNADGKVDEEDAFFVDDGNGNKTGIVGGFTAVAVYMEDVRTANFLDEDGNLIQAIECEVGQTIITPDESLEPYKFGYKFVDWVDADGKSVHGYLMPAEDINFYPEYELDKTLIGVVIGGTVVAGGVVAGVAAANTAAITGIAVVGGIAVIGGTVALVKHTHTVTYYVDGEVYKTYKILEGLDVKVPADPTKEGYEFKGWNPEIPEKMPAEDLTFEATWGVAGAAEDSEIPATGSATVSLAAFAAIASAAAAAYVISTRKKDDED